MYSNADRLLRYIWKTIQIIIENLHIQEHHMGAVKSITHSYAANQYLFWHIQRKDLPKIRQLLDKRPDLINCSLTVNYKTTPLHRAALNGNLEIAQLLVEDYHAEVDYRTSAGETPLMGAAKRDKLELVQYLLAHDCNADVISQTALTALDYAILQGNYECAVEISRKVKVTRPKTPFQYFIIAEKYKYRYVDYEILVQGLEKGIAHENLRDYLTKPKKKFNDPVVDPREPWKEWMLRNLEFKDPPLVQRSDLPEELQPQNRRFAGIRHFITKMTISPLSQRLSLEPRIPEETMSDFKLHEMKSIGTEQIEVQSVT